MSCKGSGKEWGRLWWLRFQLRSCPFTVLPWLTWDSPLIRLPEGVSREGCGCSGEGCYTCGNMCRPQVATLNEKVRKLQDELLASELQQAAAEARYDVVQRSKGLRPEASAAI